MDNLRNYGINEFKTDVFVNTTKDYYREAQCSGLIHQSAVENIYIYIQFSCALAHTIWHNIFRNAQV